MAAKNTFRAPLRRESLIEASWRCCTRGYNGKQPPPRALDERCGIYRVVVDLMVAATGRHAAWLHKRVWRETASHCRRGTRPVHARAAGAKKCEHGLSLFT